MAAGFQEPAIDAGQAQLMNWGARVLYLGPAFALTPHRNATAVLAVALDGAIGVADDPAASDPSYRTARSVLILPNSLHHLRIDRGAMAFLYVDPVGRDFSALRTRMREAGPGAPRNRGPAGCGLARQRRCTDRRGTQTHARYT
jgi:hypothetical protein